MLNKTITEENIKIFVITFYTKIMKNEIVGPFFIEILGDDMKNQKWEEHITVLCNFWALVTLDKRVYRGSPFPPHARMKGLKRETFEKWLEIFFETLDEMYEEETSLIFKKNGSIMAQNFMRNLRI